MINRTLNGRERWAVAARIALATAMVATAVALFTAALRADNTRWGADYFPNITLTTQDGKTVHFYDDLIKGKIVAIDLIYTTCQYACPLETARLAQVQRVLGDRVGRDIFFYSITIDPEHDTPQVLKEYAEKYHVGPGWLFLTGSASDIELLSKKLGLWSAPNPNNPDGHTPMLLVGNEITGQWMRNSALDNPKFLARTIGDWLTSWENGAKQALKSFAEVPLQTFDEGEYTFRNHCAACHTIGRGDAIGPDLKHVTTTRDRDWLGTFIVTPDKLFAAHDPIAETLLGKFKQVRMPNLALTDHDGAVLMDYIARESGDALPSASATAAPAMGGMPDASSDRRVVPPLAVKAAAPSGDFSALLAAYGRIQQALAADSVEGVKASALEIATETAKLGSRAATIKVAINPFAQAEDIAAARAAFGDLSDAIVAYAGSQRVGFGEMKVAYCPMARKYWLQVGDAIRNPYYGGAMLECGRFVDSTTTAGR